MYYRQPVKMLTLTNYSLLKIILFSQESDICDILNIIKIHEVGHSLHNK